jgi:hypothetical protein
MYPPQAVVSFSPPPISISIPLCGLTGWGIGGKEGAPQYIVVVGFGGSKGLAACRFSTLCHGIGASHVRLQADCGGVLCYSG